MNLSPINLIIRVMFRVFWLPVISGIFYILEKKEKISTPGCPVCGSTSYRKLRKVKLREPHFYTKFRFLKKIYSYDFVPIVKVRKYLQHLAYTEGLFVYIGFVSCQKCKSLVRDFYFYDSYIPNLETYRSGYKDLQENLEVFGRPEREKDFSLLRWLNYVQSQIVDNKKRGLDVGAAEGYFVKFMTEKKFRVFGIEPFQPMVNYARKILMIPEEQMVCDFYSEKSFPSASFDFITCFHVFEHLLFPQETALAMKLHLNDKGLLFISTPNAEALLGIYESGKPNSNFDAGHLFLCSPIGILNIFNDLNFVCKDREIVLKDTLDFSGYSARGEKNWGMNFVFEKMSS